MVPEVLPNFCPIAPVGAQLSMRKLTGRVVA